MKTIYRIIGGFQNLKQGRVVYYEVRKNCDWAQKSGAVARHTYTEAWGVDFDELKQAAEDYAGCSLNFQEKNY